MNSTNTTHRKRSLSQQAYESIRESIVTLQLLPGQMVYEEVLAESLGMSRTPVREAVRTLVAEELIEVLPQRGMRVAYIAQRKVEEARFVRELLETGAFLKVMQEYDPDEKRFADLVHELQWILNEQKKAADPLDEIAFLECDEAFHRFILQEADNNTLLSVVNQMRGHLNRLRYFALREIDDPAMIISQHEEMLKWLIEKNKSRLQEVVKRHLGQLKESVAHIAKKYPEYFIP